MSFFTSRGRVASSATNAAGGIDAAIGADAPIRSAGQDRLRRIDFAERIAAVLSALSPEEGRVFAIRGGWGFGKSSLKHLVMERLRARERRADFLDFNPWQWGDGDAIARALFGEIANALGGTYSENAAARAEKLRRYGVILTGAADPIAKVGKGSGTLTSILTSASLLAIASSVGLSLPSVAWAAAALAVVAGILPVAGKILAHLGRDRTGEPLDRMRRSLEASLRGLDRPLVVFVDDIDRLEPQQIRGLVRQVKANANLPNLTFVLIYQASIVEAALNDIADGDGAAFLEKIVQANFDLPAVPAATVHRVFTEQLTEIAGAYAMPENGFEHMRWGNSLIGCIQPYLRNLRDGRRLLSSVVVHLPLHDVAGTFEVNIVDFFLLETLRVFEPALHDLIFRERELLLQSGRFRGDGREARDRERVPALLDVVRDERRGTAQEVLTQLFPQLAWAFGGTHYGSSFQQRWLSEKRVCTSRYLPRYFELQTPEGEVSESEFVSVLNASGDAAELSRLLVGIEGRDMSASLAQRFDESVDRLPVANAAVLLPAMFGVAQGLVGTRAGDPMSSAWVSAWRAISWYLANVPAGERSGLTLDALRRTGGLSVGAILIHLNDPKNREGDGREPSLDEQGVRALKDEWLRQVVLIAREPERMLAQPDLVSWLYRWRDYTGSLDAPRRWLANSVDDDARFAALVTRMMSRGTTSGWGDRVSAPHDTFSREVVQDLIGIDEAWDRVESADGGAFDRDQAHALGVLRRHLIRWRQGLPDE